MILVRGSGNTIQEIHVFDAREREGEKRRSEREKERRVYEGRRAEERGKRSVGREGPRLVGPPPL